MATLPSPVAERLEALPRGLRDHVERARQVARRLAIAHGCDAERVDLAVAAHDLLRDRDGPTLLSEARAADLRVHPVERAVPILLHGPLAARWLEVTVGIADAEVLEAVRWHSTGRPCMTRLEMVVFLADKLDPWKVERTPYLRQVKELAYRSLEMATLEYLDRSILNLVNAGGLVHPASVEARNWLLESLQAPSPVDGHPPDVPRRRTGAQQ